LSKDFLQGKQLALDLLILMLFGFDLKQVSVVIGELIIVSEEIGFDVF